MLKHGLLTTVLMATMAGTAVAGEIDDLKQQVNDLSNRVQALQKFARPASTVNPGAAGAACGSAEHRQFAAQILEAAARIERPADPTERRV